MKVISANTNPLSATGTLLQRNSLQIADILVTLYSSDDDEIKQTEQSCS